MENLENYYGRLLTENQMNSDLKKQAKILPAMIKKPHYFICNRCGSQNNLGNALPDGSIYCRACLVFGRLTNRDSLYYFEQKPFPKGQVLRWQGQLTGLKVARAINPFSAGSFPWFKKECLP